MGFNDKFALQKILNGPCPLSSAPAAYAERGRGTFHFKDNATSALGSIARHRALHGLDAEPVQKPLEGLTFQASRIKR
jgi:hypothetical protein